MRYFLFIASSFLSLVALCQKPSVSLTVDVKNAEIGDLITFSVKSNVEGEVKIDFPPEFIQGYGATSGMEQVMDYNSGSVSTIYYIAQNGAFKENGSYTIQAFVNTKRTVYKSNKITIKIEKGGTSDEEISRKNLRQPVFGIIEQSKSKIYEGEALVLEGKIYSKLNINMLEAYQSYSLVGGADAQELEKSKQLLLRKEQIQGVSYLTFNYDKQLVFPNSTGKIKIKGFEMSLQYDDGGIFSDRIAFTSNSSTVEVLPLPAGAPKNFIGGVGEFSLETSLDKNQLKSGDVAQLTVIVNGIGNLQNIDKPKLNLPQGIVIYGDPEVKEEIVYTVRGAEGKIKYVYNLQINTNSAQKIPGVSISYFDPSKKKYVQVKEADILLNIAGNASIASVNRNVNKEIEINSKQKAEIKEMENSSSSILKKTWFWPAVLSPLFVGFLGFLFFRKKGESEVKKPVVKKNKLILSEITLELDNMQEFNVETKNYCLSNLEASLKKLALYHGENQSFSKLDFIEFLREKGQKDSDLTALKQVFNSCEELKYSFELNESQFQNTMDEAKRIVANFA